MLLGARLWLAGLLRRVGPTPLVCLPISGAQWRQRNLAPAESQPRLLAASQVQPTCPCAEAGFLYRVLSADILDQIRRTLPGGGGGGVTFTCLALGCHPRFLQVRRGRGSQERCRGLRPFWGLCFLWIPVVLISLLLGFQLIPLLPPSHCRWPVMVKGLKGGLSIT